MLDNIRKPWFNSFVVWKDSELRFHDFGGFETRNESTIKLIHLADKIHTLSPFKPVIINTDDRDHVIEYENTPVLSYCSSYNKYDYVIPDFTFDHYHQIGINDYNETICNIHKNGQLTPISNCLGWRGAGTHIYSRRYIVNLNNEIDVDAKFIQWSKTHDDPKTYKLMAENYVSIEDHPLKWKYLIDTAAQGWSCRAKFFLEAPKCINNVNNPHMNR